MKHKIFKLLYQIIIVLLFILNFHPDISSQNKSRIFIQGNDTAIVDEIHRQVGIREIIGVAEGISVRESSRKKWAVKKSDDGFSEGIIYPYRDFLNIKDSLILAQDLLLAKQVNFRSAYSYKNDLFYKNDFDTLISLLFTNYLDKHIQLENSYIKNWKLIFSSNGAFQLIVNKIRHLNDNDQYRYLNDSTFENESLIRNFTQNKADQAFFNTSEIQKEILKLTNPKEILVAFLYLGDQFNFEDNSFTKDAHRLISSLIKETMLVRNTDNNSNIKVVDKNIDDIVSPNKLIVDEPYNIGEQEIKEHLYSNSDWKNLNPKLNQNFNKKNSSKFRINSRYTPFSNYKDKNIYECYEILGDYCLSHELYSDALENYYYAINLLKNSDLEVQEGIIEEKISDLLNIYSIKNGFLKNERSIQHYQNAANIYLSNGQIDYSNISSFKKSVISINLIENLNDEAILRLKDFFNITITGLNYYWNNELDYLQKYFLFRAIGNYFDTKETVDDFKTALLYYQKSTISLLSDFKHAQYDLVLETLDRLIFTYYYLDNKEKMIFYHDLKMKLIKKIESTNCDGLIIYNHSIYRSKRSWEEKRINQLEPMPSEIHNLVSTNFYSTAYFYFIESQYYYFLKEFENKELYLDVFDRYQFSMNGKDSEVIKMNYLEDFYRNSSFQTDYENLYEVFSNQYIRIDTLNERIRIAQIDLKGKEIDIAKKNDELAFNSAYVKSQKDTIRNQTQVLKENRKLFKESEMKSHKADSMAIEKVRQSENNESRAINSMYWALAIMILTLVGVAIIISKTIKRVKRLNSKMQKVNVRSAISQLFARTDSHDLGHVLDAYKSEHDLDFEETENGQYKYLGDKSNELFIRKDVLDKNGIKSTHIYPNLISYFNQFLKTRMDFRADVAVGVQNSITSLDLYHDVFLPFNNNVIFNNRISGVLDEKLKWSLTICTDKNRNDDVKLSVGMPNDVLACHALYIIWSNVIRNTIKHSRLSTKQKANLNITHRIVDYEMNNDYYEVTLFTNVFYTLDEMQEIVNRRNQAFREKIFEKQENETVNQPRQLRATNLGSIEMAACAAYLRNLDVTLIDNEEYFDFEAVINKTGKFITGIIQAYSHLHESSEGMASLGYKFYMLKPREILVVCNNPDQVAENFLVRNLNKAQLQNFGIQFIQENEIGYHTFNHKFLVFVGNESEYQLFISRKFEILANLPKRRICLPTDCKFDRLIDLKSWCWEEWIKDKVKVQRIILQYNENKEIYLNESVKDGKIVIVYQHDEGMNLVDSNSSMYREMKCGHHWLASNIERVNDEKTKLERMSYLECVSLKVLILDEGIQKNIVLDDKKYREVLPFTKYFRQLDIIIPDPGEGEPDLNNTNLYEKITELNDFIKAQINSVNFVVIHLGMLEKLIKGEKTKEAIDKLLVGFDCGPESANRTKVIITSSRGKAANVSSDISYIPKSLIQNAIEVVFDKYRLTQVLFNSRGTVSNKI